MLGAAPQTAAQEPRTAGLCSVEGQVIDSATNAPVRKAVLTLVRKTNGQVVRTMIADSAGRFRFTNVAPGDYNLVGGARGYLLLTANAPASRRSGTMLSLSAGQEVSGIVLRLMPSAAVSGRIVDEDGDPLAGAQVQLWHITYVRGRRELASESAQKASTDDRGLYRIAGVTPGRYYLSVSDATPITDDVRYVRTYYPGAFEAGVAAPLELAPGAELENISLKLAKVQTVHVRGRVLGAAASDVLLYPDGILSSSDAYIATRSSPPDGRFEFAGVLPGAYNLLVQTREGMRSAWAIRSVSVGTAGADDVTIAPNPPISISGRIRVDDGGDPKALSNMTLWLVPTYYSPTVSAYRQVGAKEGIFEMKDIAPGRFRVQCEGIPSSYYLKNMRSGGRDWTGRILDLTAGGPAHAEAVFSPKAASVSGIAVLPGSERGTAEVTVVLIPQEKDRREDPFAYPRATTDETGRFVIRSIPPGEYRAFAWDAVEYNRYMDPEFIGRVESKGVAVSLGESGRAELKLEVIIF